MGGHVVEMTPKSKTAMSVKVNGAAFNVPDGQSKPFKSGSSDIFKYDFCFKWRLQKD